MSRAISTHINQRFDRLEAEDRGSGLAVSVAAHAAIVALAWVASTWTAAPIRIDEFSRVRLIPVAALGTQTATPQQRPTPPVRQQASEVNEPEPSTDETEVTPTPTIDPEPVTPKPPPAADSNRRSDSTSRPTQSSRQRLGSPTGSLLGTSRAGSGSASLDSPDFTYSYYTDQLLVQIESVWSRPVIGGDIEAVVRFVIRRDGSLANVNLDQSSGYNSFDLAAVRAVQAAAPFPPLPAAFRKPTLGINLVVR